MEERSERFIKGDNRLKEMGTTSNIGPAMKEMCPAIYQYIREYAFGDVHSRPGLSKRDRELVIITCLATQRDAAKELKSHVNMGLNAGLTKEEILEVFTQLTVYAGFPAAVNAVFVANEVFEERGLNKKVDEK